VLDVIEAVRSGDKHRMKAAEEEFIQYSANFSQWRYGPGGGIKSYRGPLRKALLMYMSWPMNYLNYWQKIAFNPDSAISMIHNTGGLRNLGRASAMLSAQLLILTTLAGFTNQKNLARWMVLGPVPEKVGGIVPEFFFGLARWIQVANKAVVSDVIGRPEESEAGYETMEATEKELGEIINLLD
jgi:hypothetical protein